jgi:alkanesulfonate monooxygenase SsuD/methylene tetrahydromethanopterin reductase-like flavin-dependent oxidoreductase (luciferase family)
MEFSIFLSCYYPNQEKPYKQLYDEMLDLAQLAERTGYCGLTVPEHHFMNVLMNPSPLMFAVKIASVTKSIPITAAVVVLPLHDMRRLAGEIAQADIFTEGRLQLGFGRGAFPYEFIRYGVPFEKSRELFDESLEVLEALLTQKDVSWDSENYKFDSLTIMPRPLQQPHPPFWIAAMAPMALYHCAKRGFNVQTTPLQGSMEMAKEQVDSFSKGAADSGLTDKPRLSILRVAHCTRDKVHTEQVLDIAEDYWRRFDNVFTTDGTIESGSIQQIEANQTREELAERLIVGTPDELIEKIQGYADIGIAEINMNVLCGVDHADNAESIERFAKEVMPHFAEG